MAASSATAVVTNTDQEIALQVLAAYSTSADAVDVSSYQGAMSVGTYSWLKSLGVKYVIVKLTQGTTYTNPYAQTQINNAKTAGLAVATYDYAVFTDSASAIAEADHYANVASSYGLDGSTLMIADMEDSVTKRSNIAALLNEFWNELSRRGYTNHGVYASYSYDQTYNVSSTVGHSKTWIAAYYYDYWKNTILNSDYGAWQYTDSFNGYDGSIDMGMFSTYMSLNGEKQENGHWYLYKNGVRQTGFQSLSDGRTVYYNSQGQMQYGNQIINNNKYYFNTWSGAMTLGEVTIDGRNYYYDSTTGIQEIGLVYNQATKKLQYYDPITGALKTGVTSVNNNNTTIKLNTNGSVNVAGLTNGLNKIGSNIYYYDAGKEIFIVGWQVINNQKYYFDVNTAQMTMGEKNISEYWYDFNNNGIMQSGFVKLANGKTVYYNAQGQMQYGLQTINGKIYYFNTWSGERYANREAQINGKWYNFTSDGSASTGFTKLANGKTVYYNAQGQMQYGLQTINGKIYYFNAWSGERYANREAQINGKWYNFTSDGSASTGFTKLANGKTVYYNAQGQMQYGLQTINGKIYYLNTWSGERYANREAQINGKWYNFTSDGSASTGFTKLANGKTVYYNAQGQMQYGLQTINGKIYYFNAWSGERYANREAQINGKWYNFTSDGSASTGFTKLANGKTVYYNAQGQMQYGLQTINGKIYYLNTWSGERYANREAQINGKWYNFTSDGSASTGFTKLANGKTVYYNAQGQMQYGLQTINGKIYYFNTWSGERYANREAQINGKWYNFASDGSASTGFTKLASGKTVYYNAQGQMQYGLQTINDKIYYFNTWSGEMLIDNKVKIAGVQYSFDNKGIGSKE
ncbi:GH25 family lysozyme [Limosilactobacillus mucosae]|uniref:GH25 family lysozyme n=1 Tax=Limosilactobacillus mucosae TaxID=97478 RepID=UPI003B42B7AB